MHRYRTVFLCLMAINIAAVAVPDGIYVRDGYALSVAATIPAARFMEMGPEGQLFVSLPKAGQILLCRDTNNDGVYDTQRVFIQEHPSAHAMQWHDGWLWFTETGKVLKARDADGDDVAEEVVTVLDETVLPKGGGHWWRSLLIHNGRIYTSIGDASNISDQTDTKRQKIWSYAIQGGDEQLFCSGLRNTEKLVVRPGTDEIWGMDHGSDWFGRIMERRDKKDKRQPITDLNPPGEMNLYKEGVFYGHPFLVGNRVPRYEYMDRDDIVDLAAKTEPPAWSGGAHWAPNAMEFYTGDQFPEAKGDAFVAFHGSWNSSVPVGYCVSRVLFDRGRPYGELVYARFIDSQGEIQGRPVDVVMEGDGSLLISDDQGGRIYRLRYVGN